MSLLPFDPDFEEWRQRDQASRRWFAIVGAAVLSLIGGLAVTCTFPIHWAFKLCLAASQILVFWLALSELGYKERNSLARAQELRRNGLTRPAWRRSEQELKNGNYHEIAVVEDVKVLAGKANDLSHIDHSEIVLLIKSEAVAVLDVFLIADHAYWQLGSTEFLEAHGSKASLASIFESKSVRQAVTDTQSARTEYIALGLASFANDVPNEHWDYHFTRERAAHLGEALLRHGNPDQSLSNFKVSALGRSTVAADPESQTGKRQRAAIVVAIQRSQIVEKSISLSDALKYAIIYAELPNLALQNYQHSASAPRELVDASVDFAGDVAISTRSE